MTMQEKIAAMQSKKPVRSDVFQNDNGTWSHRHDGACQWESKVEAETDFRFSRDWYRGRA